MFMNEWILTVTSSWIGRGSQTIPPNRIEWKYYLLHLHLQLHSAIALNTSTYIEGLAFDDASDNDDW